MFFAQQSSLFDFNSISVIERPKIVKPAKVAKEQWPPDYRSIYFWRISTLQKLRDDPALLASAKAYYSTRPAEFIMHWVDTYDPRRSGSKWVPFIFFDRQLDFVQFLSELRRDQENGLCEKSRDMGITWQACAYSVHSWLFIPDDAIGWGSRKQELVDRIGDPDSIFEKIRLIVKRLPDVFIPDGFSWRDHATFMKMINPENNATITGESGDNIGRGGRKAMYFKDESAHYERPEKIESALGDNTNVQVDISSVNGLGNVFHRRREAGVDWRPGLKIDPGYTRVFVMDWSDHPEKTLEWYETRKTKFEREGMAHVFAQEVDRNYSAAIQNTIIPYEWIKASVDAHLKVPYLLDCARSEQWLAGLDIADEGNDRNALTKRQSIIWRHAEEWGERDPGVSARRAAAACRHHRGIRVMYDNIGIGAAVKAETNRLIDEKIITADDILFIGWNAGSKVINPFERIIPDDDESSLNKDFFHNIKAQAWWSLRTRFYKTWKAVTDGAIYPADELISLDSGMPLLHQLMKELAQPTRGENAHLKQVVNKKPDGTKSPNLADAGVMMYFPITEKVTSLVGSYGA